MQKKGTVLRLIVAATLVMAVASCATFEEESSTRDGEIVVFDEIAFDNAVSLEDLENLGSVEVTRTISYELMENGDWTVEMDDYSYSYSAVDGQGTETGTRVVGNLKAAKIAADGAAGAAGVAGGLGLSFGGLLGGPEAGAEEEGAQTKSARQFVTDAVNYDLHQPATEKGAMAILLPEYSWETERVVKGSTMSVPFLGPSRTVTSDVIEYTVTARGTAVTF